MATFRRRGKKWRCEIRRKGVYESDTFHSKGEAEAWARQVETEIDAGRRIARGNATVADAFDRYARDVSPRHKGARWEKIRLRKLKGYPLARIWLHNLHARDLAAFRDERSKEVAPASVNRELTLIGQVLETARKEWGLLAHNPLKDVKRLTPPRHRERRITDKEIEAICTVLGFDRQSPPANGTQEVGLMFCLAIETAMRLGEICALQPGDIRLKERYVVLRDSKNRDTRHVPLSKEAGRLLKLLNGRGFRMGAGSASATFYKAKEQARLHDLTFHDTRHEALTRLARKLDVLDLARMVGHRDPRSLMTYYNPTPAEIASRLG